MKVFEKIATKGESREKVFDYMYDNRILACNANDEMHYISDDEMNKLCDGDCLECLDKFLDSEVEDENNN